MLTPYFNEDHTLFRQSVRDFIEKEVTPHAEEWEAQEELPRSIWKRMGELGFLGLHWPEKYGGSKADFFYSVIFTEEVARSTMGGFAAAVGVHQYMSVAHIAEVGSEAIKQKYLTGAISGDKIGALAISEPGAGSDVANIRTTAIREGDHYILNGSKIFITNGVNCDFAVVACKTKPEAGMNGISLLVVDRNSEGFTANKLKKIGWHSSDTGELFFDNVKVPVENIVGEEGKGFYYIMDSFQLERLIAGIGAVAAAEYGLEVTLQYIHEREAFGRPIGKFQVIRHMLVDVATEVEAAKQLTYYACWLFDKKQFAVKECSMVKLLTSEVAKKAADVCLQCFGGYGYMEEYPIARMYRDARVGTIVGGTSQIMREIIAKMMIDSVQYNSAYKAPKQKASISQNSSATNGRAKALTPPKEKEKENTPIDAVVDKPKKEEAKLAKEALTEEASTPVEVLEPPIEENKAPTTAREIILSLENRLKPNKLKPDYTTNVHFDISGSEGGQFTVHIGQGECKVSEGHTGTPKCIVTATDEVYTNVELGKENPQMAVMMGRLQLSDIGEMMTFSKLFERLF